MTLLKTLVFGLLLANTGYFLWLQGVGKAAVPVVQVAPSLQLASEAHVSVPAVVALAAVPAKDESDVAEPVRCVSIGPFQDVSEAAHAASSLRASLYDPRQRVAEGEVWAGVWVYLPVPASRLANDQMLAKLKENGIDDALTMPGPGDSSVVSLGLFSEPKRAQARVAQAQGLGYKPTIVDRKRTGDVYWIDLNLKSTDSLANLAQLQGKKGRIVRLDMKACPAVAAN